MDAFDDSVLLVVALLGLVGVAMMWRRTVGLQARTHRYAQQLFHLEEMSRILLRQSPQEQDLGQILADHIPAMFPDCRVAVWLFLDRVLYQADGDWQPDFALISAFLSRNTRAQRIGPSENLPWQPQECSDFPTLLVPIIAQVGGEAIGGILVQLRTGRPGRRAPNTGRDSLATAKALAEQLSAHFENMDNKQRAIYLQRLSQEISLASQIQRSLLPRSIPNLPGWELGLSFLPVEELSGDFFDFIPLSENHLGIVIADVAGKGLGASLYMALSRTLIRTFAFEYPFSPEIVLSEANERILRDARAPLFVTVFLGVLDLDTHTLTYCNAGHNPPYLFAPDGAQPRAELTHTGLPLGIDGDAFWQSEQIAVERSESLLLYSDGVTDAQNEAKELFGAERLQETAGQLLSQSADEMCSGVLAALRRYTGGAAQFDDITMLVLKRGER